MFWLTGKPSFLASTDWWNGQAYSCFHNAFIIVFWMYLSLFVHLPGQIGGGTTGGCTIPLMGSRIDSSLGSGSCLDISEDICKHKHDA